MNTCRSCQAEIMFCLTADQKRMPVDPEPNPDGNLLVRIGRNGPECRVITAELQPMVGEARYMPHWKTCPNADQHRRNR